MGDKGRTKSGAKDSSVKTKCALPLLAKLRFRLHVRKVFDKTVAIEEGETMKKVLPTKIEHRTKRCPHCNRVLAVEKFSKCTAAKDGLKDWCKECRATASREWWADNPEKYEKYKAASRERYANDPEWREERKAAGNTANNEIFIETLCHYSQPGDPWFLHCIHCGISDVDLLTLDHVNNDGHIYNKKGKRLGGIDLAIELRKRGWPEDIKIQILCFNCNTKKEKIRCRQQAAINNSKLSEEHRKLNEDGNEKYRQTRLKVLQHIGPNGEAKCAHCGEDDYDMLDIDHINGRGKRKTLFEKLGSKELATWLKKNNWPDVSLHFQVLCRNCNQLKHFDGLT